VLRPGFQLLLQRDICLQVLLQLQREHRFECKFKRRRAVAEELRNLTHVRMFAGSNLPLEVIGCEVEKES